MKGKLYDTAIIVPDAYATGFVARSRLGLILCVMRSIVELYCIHNPKNLRIS